MPLHLEQYGYSTPWEKACGSSAIFLQYRQTTQADVKALEMTAHQTKTVIFLMGCNIFNAGSPLRTSHRYAQQIRINNVKVNVLVTENKSATYPRANTITSKMKASQRPPKVDRYSALRARLTRGLEGTICSILLE